MNQFETGLSGDVKVFEDASKISIEQKENDKKLFEKIKRILESDDIEGAKGVGKTLNGEFVLDACVEATKEESLRIKNYLELMEEKQSSTNRTGDFFAMVGVAIFLMGVLQQSMPTLTGGAGMVWISQKKSGGEDEMYRTMSEFIEAKIVPIVLGSQNGEIAKE